MPKEGALSFHLVSGIINSEELEVGLQLPAHIHRRTWQFHLERVGESQVLRVELSHRFTGLPGDCGLIIRFESEDESKAVSLQKIRDMSVDMLTGYVELVEGKVYKVRVRPIHSYNNPCLEVRERRRRKSGPRPHP